MVCFSITLGLALVVGGIYLTGWNEANLVCSAGAYDKAAAETKPLDTCSKNTDLLDQFVYLSCPVEQSLVTSESSTGISATGAYKLTFETEQWGFTTTSETETTGTRTCDKNGRCTDDTRSCSCLQKTWTISPITQSKFSSITFCQRCPRKQYSASIPPDDAVWGSTPTSQLGYVDKYADHVPLGDGTIQIDGSDISLIKNQQLITAPTVPTAIDSVNDFELVDSELCGASGNKLMCYKSLTKRVTTVNATSTDITDNVIGDLRLTVKAYGSTTISALGKQTSNSNGNASLKVAEFGKTKLPPCKAREIFYAVDGTKSSSEIYQGMHDNLRTLTTILRVVSFILIFAGFYSIFSPIQNGADMIPCIGDLLASIVGFVLYIVCGLITLSIWFTTFSITWIFYRPVYGSIFLVIAASFGAAAFYIGRRQVAKKRERGVEMYQEDGRGKGVETYPEAEAYPFEDGKV